MNMAGGRFTAKKLFFVKCFEVFVKYKRFDHRKEKILSKVGSKVNNKNREIVEEQFPKKQKKFGCVNFYLSQLPEWMEKEAI